MPSYPYPQIFKILIALSMGQDNTVSIATRYGLGGPGIESRWVARVSAPVQNGAGAHQASCTRVRGLSWGVKRPVR